MQSDRHARGTSRPEVVVVPDACDEDPSVAQAGPDAVHRPLEIQVGQQVRQRVVAGDHRVEGSRHSRTDLADVGTAEGYGEAAGLRLPPGSLDGAPAQVRSGRPISQRGQGQRLRADSAGAVHRPAVARPGRRGLGRGPRHDAPPPTSRETAGGTPSPRRRRTSGPVAAPIPDGCRCGWSVPTTIDTTGASEASTAEPPPPESVTPRPAPLPASQKPCGAEEPCPREPVSRMGPLTDSGRLEGTGLARGWTAHGGSSTRAGGPTRPGTGRRPRHQASRRRRRPPAALPCH